MAVLLPDALLLSAGLVLFMFGIQTFLTESRRKFANEMIKATTQSIVGLFLVWLWWKNVSIGGNNKGYSYA
jgi:hypothetical protein